MEEVVASVFDLMGKTADPQLEEEVVKQRVDAMFKVKGCVITIQNIALIELFTGIRFEW